MLPRTNLTISALIFSLGVQDDRYVEDFEFVSKTVADRAAAIELRKLDWPRITDAHRPRFEQCQNDLEHVCNLSRLLAELSDSHTGLTRTSVEGTRPSKYDGMDGAGLWIGWGRGRFMLRGLVDGHPLAPKLQPGSAIVAIDGLPTWLVMEREKRRITMFQGSSSDHSLFASMGNRMLPFGDAKTLVATFFDVGDRATQVVELPRWEPEGKRFNPRSATVPSGLSAYRGAVSRVMQGPGSSRIGYLRITGSMNPDTVTAFHRALEPLKEVDALLLDCRRMGGGSDQAAWEMCGRLFPDGVDNGLHGHLEPSGDWQFEGPVVMLQDEMEISAAETFTWAMSETDRCVSVGRSTGGWAIIPTTFDCPSGLASFRLGVHARETPIQRVVTEGTGWPADLVVPLGPVFCSESDAVRDIGMQVLTVLDAGVTVKEARELFGLLPAGNSAGFLERAAALAERIPAWDPALLADRFARDLEQTLLLETAMLDPELNLAPDVVGARSRAEGLQARAKRAGLEDTFRQLEAAIANRGNDLEAQLELLELLDAEFGVSEAARNEFLERHKGTQLAELVESW